LNVDFRVSTHVLQNKKIKRLIRRKGHTGFYNLISLWAYTATQRPSGILHEMDREDIMDAAESTDETFVGLLVDLGLLDHDGASFSIHNWVKHNGYAAHAEQRSQKARDAANKRWSVKYGEEKRDEKQ